MSTRITLDHGDDFHVFAQLFDAGHIHLQLTGVEFQATPSGVVLSLPLDLWERIRRISSAQVEDRVGVEDHDEDVAGASGSGSAEGHETPGRASRAGTP